MQYSISDLEQLSGIQSHTIRIWEQRYNALNPHRSAGNTRYYDEKQLLRLLNIVSISKQGLKISKICSLSDEAIHQLIEQEITSTISDNLDYEFYISKLLNYGIVYDELNFNRLLNQCFVKYDVSISYQFIIYPLLVRLGLMWRKDSICAAQEHFLTHLIRQKLFVAIENLPIVKTNQTWLLFLPQEEEHEMGLLYANYVLRRLKQKVIYLGAKVPLQSVDQVIQSNQIHHMLIFLVHPNLVANTQVYIDQLANKYSHIAIHLAGNQQLLANLKLPANITLFRSIEQFELLIQSTNLC